MSAGCTKALKDKIGAGTANHPGGTMGKITMNLAPIGDLPGQRIGGEKRP